MERHRGDLSGKGRATGAPFLFTEERVRAELEQWGRDEAERGIAPEHRSFGRQGSPGGPGVLLVHGGGGSPADFVDLAEDLAAHGARVLCPLLPAHGLGERALVDLRFEDLLGRALEARDLLAADHRPVLLVAQSLGAVVGIRIAAETEVAGFVALAPALRPFVLRRVLRLARQALSDPELTRITWGWQLRARGDIRRSIATLHDVRCPLLVVHSRDDDSVDPRGAEEFLAGAGSVHKRLEMLDGQGHVLSMAPDRHRLVFPLVRSFVRATTDAWAARNRSSGPRT